jgi:hypothetical protein
MRPRSRDWRRWRARPASLSAAAATSDGARGVVSVMYAQRSNAGPRVRSTSAPVSQHACSFSWTPPTVSFPRPRPGGRPHPRSVLLIALTGVHRAHGSCVPVERSWCRRSSPARAPGVLWSGRTCRALRYPTTARLFAEGVALPPGSRRSRHRRVGWRTLDCGTRAHPPCAGRVREPRPAH